MKILFVGDIVGRLGRAAAVQAIATWRAEHNPDFVIANVENIAHGSGVTKRTLDEIMEAGIDCCTSGNHIWRHKEILEIFEAGEHPVLRPANYAESLPGCGYQILSSVSQKKVCVINLLGRIYMNELVDNPFTVFDIVLAKVESEQPDVIIVDFHAEATSEKQAFGYYADGRVSAVLGTHTHVQTNDARVLPKGTAYITDAGFVGGEYSVLGVEADGIINSLVTGMRARHEYPEVGSALANAVLLNIDSVTTATAITPLVQQVTVE